MSKVININGMAVKVIDNTEKQETLSQEDKDMDIRAKEAVKAALEKAKVCKKPIARYDIETKRAYIEDAEGNRRYVE
ncbi:hypothetical protein [Ruminococcus flavefaciens]|jgi:hypothetical protein|uniref:hypothetical protein n=1 Tax=Ruminococcus flavefaciens TaxID=1265 RepID=UPI0026024F3F|nr:hypothetical protein [Ruminococcus flavefaciens]MBQ3948299.1 hypothetical protein [Ruminococcus sp.]